MDEDNYLAERYGYDPRIGNLPEGTELLGLLREVFRNGMDEAEIERRAPEARKLAKEHRQKIREGRERGHYGSVVYFMRLGNRVKIGYTSNLRARLVSFQPEELLCTVDGGIEVERRLHQQFAKYRVVGEWFLDCHDIRAFAARVKEQQQRQASG